MKKIVAAFICAFLLFSGGIISVNAEEAPEDLPASESVELELEEEMVRQQAFGRDIRAGGGFAAGIMRADLSELNDILQAEGFADLSSTIFMMGGGGSGGSRRGHRFGGFGLGGSVESSEGQQKAILDVGFGGFLYEHGVYVEDDIDLALGVMLGGGEKELSLIADHPDDFSQIVEDVAGDSHNSVTMEKSFVALQPQANLHYRLTNFLGLNFTAGYLLSHDFGSKWEIADRPVDDGPLSNFRGANFRLGLNLGF